MAGDDLELAVVAMSPLMASLLSIGVCFKQPEKLTKLYQKVPGLNSNRRCECLVAEMVVFGTDFGGILCRPTQQFFMACCLSLIEEIISAAEVAVF